MRKNAFVWAIIAAVLILPAAVYGQLWNGAGAGDNWTTNENWAPDPDIPWEPGAPPIKDGTANVLFGAAGAGNSNIDLGVGEDSWHINSLTFEADAGEFALTGGPLKMGGGGIANTSGNEQAFGAKVIVAANQTWTASGDANILTLTGGLHVEEGAQLTGASAARFQVLEGGLTGSGTIRLNAAWAVAKFYGDNTSFTGEINRTSQSYVDIDSDYGLGGPDSLLTIRGANRNDFRYEGEESQVRLANKTVITGNSEVGWSGATFIHEGATEIRSRLRPRGTGAFEGDVFGAGNIGRAQTTGHITFDGVARYLGLTLIDFGTSSLTVNGVLTAGDMVDDGDGGEVFQQADMVTVARHNVGDEGAILQGAGEINREVLLVGAGHVYWDFTDSIFRASGASAQLRGSLSFGGIVTVNSTAGSGNVTILDGGTLKGIGRIGGDVAILDGGTLAPGTDIGYEDDGAGGVLAPSPIGTLRLRPYSETFPEPTEEDPDPDPFIDSGSTLTFEPGATARFQLASTESHDRVEDIGTLNYGGTLVIELFEKFVPEVGNTFHLFGFQTRGDESGFTAFNFPAIEGIAWSFNHDTGVLSVVEPSGDLPVAENVGIVGAPIVGQTLTGTYDFVSGTSEGTSTFRWLRADTVDGAYMAIDGATEQTYTLTPADAGKFITFEVTPVDIENTTGEAAASDPTGPAYVLGDFNGDGVLSGLDIPGFKQALADPDGWATANPDRPHPNLLGDFNGDGVFSGLDIPGFKQALAGN